MQKGRGAVPMRSLLSLAQTWGVRCLAFIITTVSEKWFFRQARQNSQRWFAGFNSIQFEGYY